MTPVRLKPAQTKYVKHIKCDFSLNISVDPLVGPGGGKNFALTQTIDPCAGVNRSFSLPEIRHAAYRINRNEA